MHYIMRHGMRRNDNFMHAWVSKDTVSTKIGLEELGKGLRIPADTFNLNTSMRGPAPCQFDAMAIEISSPRGEG